MSSKRVRVALVAIIAVAGLTCWDLADVSAQTISNSTVQSVLQSLGASTGQAAGTPAPPPAINVTPAVTPSTQTLAPAAPPTTSQLPPSTLELLFSQRAGQPLQQFGYDLFGIGSSVAVTQIGAVQDTYILGPGDQLSIVNRGHDSNSYVVPVDRDGRVIVPGYSPVQAAGRTFGQVRQDLQAVIAKDALHTQSFISLGQTRQISVLVSGEVNAPGARTLSGLNTPIDALLLSGGVRKTGSLRDITLVRGSKRIRLDLYSAISHGDLAEVGNLTEGDHIIVPPIGQTVAVIGLVNRPGIYELPPGAQAIDGKSLIRLAGGSFAGANHLSKVALAPTGRRQLVSLGENGTLQRGEVLSVDQQASGSLGRVTLAGAVALAGTRPLNEVPTLAQLVHEHSDLTPNAYTPFAILIHRDPRTNFRRAIAFSLARVFAGQYDVKLGDDDVVYVLTTDQARALAIAAAAQVQAAAQSASVPPSVVTQVPNFVASLSSSSISATPTPSGSPTTPANNAATIYAAANGGTGQAAGSTTLPSGNASSQQSTQTPGTSSTASTQGASSSNGSQSGSALPSGMSTTTTAPTAPAPNPSIAMDPRFLAAQSQQLPASIALLQAQSTQSNTSGLLPQGGGLTTSSALGMTPVDNNPNDLAMLLGITPQALINLAADHLINIVGEVHDPGAYLTDDGTSLAAMLNAAAGLDLQADLSSIEVTSTEIDPSSGTSRTLRNAYKGRSEDFEKVALHPLDTVRVRQVFSDEESGTVTLVGQVRYPGSFDIMRNERLSSLIARAGGLTDEAYPYGAVVTRISAQQAEAEGNYREALQLQAGATVAATTPNVSPSLLPYLQTLEQALLKQPALGRISVTADPTILAVKPELDSVMQPGDFVYIPKRPSTVAVSGEVINPGSFQYKPNMSVDDYLKLSGGSMQSADNNSIFVILPDGSARPASSDFFDFFGNDPLPPGSTIVVPPDPAPFNTMVFLQNIAQIVSQVAIAGASLAVINSNHT